jgi:hypothetical protein
MGDKSWSDAGRKQVSRERHEILDHTAHPRGSVLRGAKLSPTVYSSTNAVRSSCLQG